MEKFVFLKSENLHRFSFPNFDELNLKLISKCSHNIYSCASIETRSCCYEKSNQIRTLNKVPLHGYYIILFNIPAQAEKQVVERKTRLECKEQEKSSEANRICGALRTAARFTFIYIRYTR